MVKVDLSDFYAETETSETRAYEHALDIEFIVHREMQRSGLSKSELAKRIGVSLQSLSKLLNSQAQHDVENNSQSLSLRWYQNSFLRSFPVIRMMAPFSSSNNFVRESMVFI